MMTDLTISLSQLDEIQSLAERAERSAAAKELPMPPAVHVDLLRQKLQEMAAKLRTLYVDISGENPWHENPWQEHHP